MMKARVSWLGAILLALFFLIANIHISYRRLLWFDEIGTLKITKLPDLAAIWQVQTSARADSAPIGYHILAKLSYNLSGHDDISIRILSALGMSAAFLVVFDCARRLTDGTHGLIAFCALASTFFLHYGYEGRPYTLVVLFTSIALWLWLHTKPDSMPAAAAFGVAIFLALTMHFNSVLVMVPFGVWDLYHWRLGKMPSRKLIAGVAATVCAFGISVQQMKQSAGWTAESWCPPSLYALVRVFPEIVSSGLLVLAVFAIPVCLLRIVAKPMGDAERLCWLFLTIPMAGLVLAYAVTNSFYNRYLIAILPGISVAFACLVSRHLPKSVSMAFLLFLAVLVAGRQLGYARKPEAIEPPSSESEQLHTREAMAVEDRIVANGKSVIVTDVMLLAEARYYSRRPEMYVMYGPGAIQAFCRYFGAACWDLDLAKSHVNELASIYPSDNLLSAMTQAGFQATVKMTNPTVVYFSAR